VRGKEFSLFTAGRSGNFGGRKCFSSVDGQGQSQELNEMWDIAVGFGYHPNLPLGAFWISLLEGFIVKKGARCLGSQSGPVNF